MGRSATTDIVQRRLAIISACSDDPCTSAELVSLIGAAKRTIDGDLAWLARRHPSQFIRVSVSGRTGRVGWRWDGALPIALPEPPAWLSEHELVALVAARDAPLANPASFNTISQKM